SKSVQRLQSVGIRVHEGHDSGYLDAPDLLVVSSAVPDNNPEVVEATRRCIPTFGRGEILAELALLKQSVAVAGSHGKTTTASMIAYLLEAGGFDPTAVIGGVVRAFRGNTRHGDGAFIVLEADESDRSFLYLRPDVAVLTNIDHEHLDAYDGFDGLMGAFEEFANRVPVTGRVVVCADDPVLADMAKRLGSRALTYGLDNTAASIRAQNIVLKPDGSSCLITLCLGEVTKESLLRLRVPGRHNVSNALAAIATATCLGIDIETAVNALECFTGVERRFQRYRTSNNIDVIDDYAHHPTEIAAVIDTARLSCPRRLVVLFQPHRYTRTARLLTRFGETLACADEVLLTNVYAASESQIEGVDAFAIAAEIERFASIPVHVVDSVDLGVEHAVASVGDGDMLVVLGAGSIGKVAKKVVHAIEQRRWS
ncbi:MAG: UDP-N-acetylmuramate--L-alanine ligase, partial [Acidobacteriota bacterium]|nr:UDP-N-acetylmuramate--L-alanine ligase [Acidobacteriota bacterium]